MASSQYETLNKYRIAALWREKIVEARTGFPLARQVFEVARTLGKPGETVVMEHKNPPFRREDRHSTIG